MSVHVRTPIGFFKAIARNWNFEFRTFQNFKCLHGIEEVRRGLKPFEARRRLESVLIGPPGTCSRQLRQLFADLRARAFI